MEPSGRNPRQPVANESAAKTAQTGENPCRRLRPGKEGVRRFESVRGLPLFACLAAVSVVCAGSELANRRPRSVHERPRWTLSGAELVEEADRALAPSRRDGRSGGRSSSGWHPCIARARRSRCQARSAKGGKGVSQIVDPAQRLDPGRDLRRLAFAVAEVVQVEVAAPIGGEHEPTLPIEATASAARWSATTSGATRASARSGAIPQSGWTGTPSNSSEGSAAAPAESGSSGTTAARSTTRPSPSIHPRPE
jgi:hypothetical protein